MAATKGEFLRAYREAIVARYDWAKSDMDRVNRLVRSASHKLATGTGSWSATGEAVLAAWQVIGGVGTPTLEDLRGLRP